jgi:hypothetical protein
MTASSNSVQHRFIDTIHVLIALNSGFIFAGVIFTWISIQFYYALLGGGLDLYPGYYEGLGRPLRFLPFGFVVTALSHLVYWRLPKSNWAVGIFVPELVIDAIIINHFLEDQCITACPYILVLALASSFL